MNVASDECSAHGPLAEDGRCVSCAALGEVRPPASRDEMTAGERALRMQLRAGVGVRHPTEAPESGDQEVPRGR